MGVPVLDAYRASCTRFVLPVAGADSHCFRCQQLLIGPVVAQTLLLRIAMMEVPELHSLQVCLLKQPNRSDAIAQCCRDGRTSPGTL
jgi:hypothetical protein